MRRWPQVLILIAGLGSPFSFAQFNPQSDPFNRYLAGIKARQLESALVRFAAECRMDVSKIQPRYAVGPGSSLSTVKSLANGLRSLGTDFYSTAEVWHSNDRVFVEMWANSDDVGSEVRYMKCFENLKLVQAEVIDWNVPVSQAPDVIAWGYSRRWERSSNGRMRRSKEDFVDEMERTISKPKLDEEDKKNLLWIPPLGSLASLNLPQSMLK